MTRAKIPLAGVLTLVFGAYLYYAYFSSPNYLSGQQMEMAAELVQAGQPGAAAHLYAQVAQGPAARSKNATNSLRALLDPRALDASAPEQLVEIFRAAVIYEGAGKTLDIPLILLAGRYSERYEEDRPMVAKGLLDAVWPLAADHERALMQAGRQRILERLLETRPGHVELATQLALIHESNGDAKAAEALLMPIAERLGTGEGRRIVGQLLLLRGELEKAEPHLRVYLERWLPPLLEAETNYRYTTDRIWSDTVSRLNRGYAPEGFAERLTQMTEEEQAAAMQSYFDERAAADSEYKLVSAELNRYAHVVPVVIDLARVLVGLSRVNKNGVQAREQLDQAAVLLDAVADLGYAYREYHETLAVISGLLAG